MDANNPTPEIQSQNRRSATETTHGILRWCSTGKYRRSHASRVIHTCTNPHALDGGQGQHVDIKTRMARTGLSRLGEAWSAVIFAILLTLKAISEGGMTIPRDFAQGNRASERVSLTPRWQCFRNRYALLDEKSQEAKSNTKSIYSSCMQSLSTTSYPVSPRDLEISYNHTYSNNCPLAPSAIIQRTDLAQSV